MSDRPLPPGCCDRCGLRYSPEELREVRPGRPMCAVCRREWLRADLKDEIGFKPGLRYQLIQCGRRWGKCQHTQRRIDGLLKEIEEHPEKVLSGQELEAKMDEWETEDGGNGEKG